MVFGYPGGAILLGNDAMLDHPIRHILVRHEQVRRTWPTNARATGVQGRRGGLPIRALALPTWSPALRPRDDGLHPDGLHHRPGWAAAIGTDAFQETDVTGITLPVTKHNYLVSKASDMVPAVREAFASPKSGRPGPGSSTSPRTRR